MKNKTFIIRTINLILIVVALFGYQSVTTTRVKEEQQLYAEYQQVLADANQMQEQEAAGNTYKDGIYDGAADGFGGEIEVQVEVEDGKIQRIEVTSARGEDTAYLTMSEQVIDRIMESQQLEVDTVSGATYSSTGIKNAVKNALEEAVE